MAVLQLTPGRSYRVRALVTNGSTKGGQPIGAAFTIEWWVSLTEAGLDTRLLLNTSDAEIFASGEPRTLERGFALPSVITEDGCLVQVIVKAGGQQLAKASEVFAISQIQTFIASDDWTQKTQTDGIISLHQVTTILVGWSGGALMEQEEGVILFVGLPTAISRATLVLTPTEYLFLLPGDETIVKVGVAEVGRDGQASLAPLRIDITEPLKATAFTPEPGALSIILSPTLVPLTPRGNWLRKYGSIRGVESARPRIEVG